MVSTISAADLYITGNLTAGGTVQANYADLAEYFVTDDSILVGEPVSIIGNRKVGKYNGKAYVGVRSLKPGFTMGGEIGEAVRGEPGGGIPIAFIGSVLVNTLDENICVGDKLVLKKDGKIIKKKWYHFFTQYVGVSQDNYNGGGQVMCLIGVR